MPFVLRPGVSSGTPNEMFLYRGSIMGPTHDALLIATLEDGSMLTLSGQRDKQARSVWPLDYCPYVIRHNEAVAWLKMRKKELIRLRQEFPDVNEDIQEHGLGDYLGGIGHLRIGDTPTLTVRVFGSENNEEVVREYDHFNFSSPIVSFTPEASFKEAREYASTRMSV